MKGPCLEPHRLAGFQPTPEAELTRFYFVLALFWFLLIVFGLIMGQSVAALRDEDEQPRGFWALLAVQALALAFVLVLLVVHTH
jgi:hypothetical protein